MFHAEDEEFEEKDRKGGYIVFDLNGALENSQEKSDSDDDLILGINEETRAYRVLKKGKSIISQSDNMASKKSD